MNKATDWREIAAHPQYIANDLGEIWHRLSASVTPHGYERVSLMRDGATHYKYIHSLLCEAFIGPAPRPRAKVEWLDGDRLNNRLTNVRWAGQVGEPDAGTSWAAIADFPGYAINGEGRVIRRLGSHDNGNGYIYVHIKAGRGFKTRGVHVLVCEAFHGAKPSPDLEAAHGNGVRSDNRPHNLRWATRVENMADKVLHGTHRRGAASSVAKLSADAVRDIRMRKARGDRGVEIAAAHGVHEVTVLAIARGASRRHG